MYTNQLPKKSNTRTADIYIYRSVHRIYTQFTPLEIKYKRNSIEIGNLTHRVALLINFHRIYLCQKQSVSFWTASVCVRECSCDTHKIKMKLISTEWCWVFVFCDTFYFCWFFSLSRMEMCSVSHAIEHSWHLICHLLIAILTNAIQTLVYLYVCACLFVCVCHYFGYNPAQ